MWTLGRKGGKGKCPYKLNPKSYQNFTLVLVTFLYLLSCLKSTCDNIPCGQSPNRISRRKGEPIISEERKTKGKVGYCQKRSGTAKAKAKAEAEAKQKHCLPNVGTFQG
jgi:hypothetical protein